MASKRSPSASTSRRSPCRKRTFRSPSRRAMRAPYARLARLRSSDSTFASGFWRGRQERFVAGPSPGHQHGLDRTSGGPFRVPAREGLAEIEIGPRRKRGPARIRVLLVLRPYRAGGGVLDRGQGRKIAGDPALLARAVKRVAKKVRDLRIPRLRPGPRPAGPRRQGRSRDDRGTRAAGRRRAPRGRAHRLPRGFGRGARRARREAPPPPPRSRTTRTRCGSTVRRGRRRAGLQVRPRGRRLRPHPRRSTLADVRPLPRPADARAADRG